MVEKAKKYRLLASLDTNCLRVKDKIREKGGDSVLIFITPTVELESNCHQNDIKRFSDIYEELKVDEEELRKFEKIINRKYEQLIEKNKTNVQPNDVKIIVESAFISNLFKATTYLITKDFKMKKYENALREEDKFFYRLIAIRPKHIANYIH